MDYGYSWEQQGTYEPPKEGGIGWAVLVAVVLALLLHVVFLVWGGSHLIKFDITEPDEWVSDPVRLETQMQKDQELISEPPPEEEIERPDTEGELVADVEDVLPELQDVEIDISPLDEVALPEMKIEKPALKGEEDGDILKPTVGVDVSANVPELGTVENLFPEAKASQLIVDSGSPLDDVLNPEDVTAELGKAKGAGGLADNGALTGYTGLEAYSKMSPGDLQRNKASIGSDLLFEFGKTSLRDDARLTLMTVAMLIDRNPDMYCWVEGHTDLFGGDDYNKALAEKRGRAVKDWLVDALQLSPERIVVRSFGKEQPVVLEGSIEEQAANRRVDIKMRKTLPGSMRVLVKPGKAILVEEDEEVNEVPRAIPVEEEVPRAIPVEE
ncbi:OmpA family protein [Akkermansiaceae bacterium]|nr:OmpA family protein [Akkermansiaceae bacterium]